MANYLVVTVKSWNVDNFRKLQAEDTDNQWFLIDRKEDFTLEAVQVIQPRYIFFPHWSWIIPKQIFSAYECIVFHMTDLPYGRGGSPLQNLIVRGKTDTQVSALRVAEGMDTGDIYMKRPLSLVGSAEEIFRRLSDLVFTLIPEIVRTTPAPVPQTGEVVEFVRRKPEDGNIAELQSIEAVYDYIRMLDAEGYPSAFVETGNLRLEFAKASLDQDKKEVEAVVRIRLK